MTRFSTLPLRTLILTMAVGLSGHAAIAQSADEPLQKTVGFGELDLSKPIAAEQLYVRLNAAAKQVCEPVNGAQVRQKYQYRSCVNETLANAVAEINHPLLTSVYDAKGGSTIKVTRVATK